MLLKKKRKSKEERCAFLRSSIALCHSLGMAFLKDEGVGANEIYFQGIYACGYMKSDARSALLIGENATSINTNLN